MTAKILQHDGEVVYHSTYQSLTVEEQADLHIHQDIVTFRESVEDFLGEKLTHNELHEVRIPDIPEYIPYAKKDQNKMTFQNLDEEVTP